MILLICNIALASNTITDTLEQGQTKTYTLNGYDFEITASEIYVDQATIIINGEMIYIQENECISLEAGFICANQIAGNTIELAMTPQNNARHNLEINKVNVYPEGEITPGKFIIITLDIENKGQKDEENVYVQAMIDGLNTGYVLTIDEIQSGETITTEDMYIPIPEDAQEGLYRIETNVYYNDGQDYNSKAEYFYVTNQPEMDLSDYPQMFIQNGKQDVTIVVGDNAPASDVIAATNIAIQLQEETMYYEEENEYGVISGEIESTRLASEIAGQEKDMNLIAIGQPCNNMAVSVLLGTQETCSLFEEDEASIKLFKNNNKYQMIITGGSDNSVREAAKFVTQYEQNQETFDKATDEIMLSMTEIQTIEAKEEYEKIIQNTIEEMEYSNRIQNANICIKVPIGQENVAYYQVNIDEGETEIEGTSTNCGDQLEQDFLIQFENTQKFEEFTQNPSFTNLVNGEEYGTFNYGISKFVDSNGMHFTNEFKQKYCGIITANTNIIQRTAMGLWDCGRYAKEQGYSEKFDGETTQLNQNNLDQINYLTIQKQGIGKIEFPQEELDLTGLDPEYEKYIEITTGKVSIDTQKLPQLANKSAMIFMEGLSFLKTPKIMMDGKECENICSQVEYDAQKGILTFNVAHFTTFQLEVSDQEINKQPYQKIDTPKNKAKIQTITMPQTAIKIGEQARIGVNVKNNGDFDMEKLKVIVSIPELGIEKSAGHINLEQEEKLTKWLIAEIPEDTQPGEYDVKITVRNHDVERIKHRILIVE